MLQPALVVADAYAVREKRKGTGKYLVVKPRPRLPKENAKTLENLLRELEQISSKVL